MGGQSVVGGLVQGTWYKPPNYSNTIYIAHMKQMKSNESVRCLITFQQLSPRAHHACGYGPPLSPQNQKRNGMSVPQLGL